MVDLDEIKSRVDAAAAKVVELKSAKADVADIKASVGLLLAAKKEYADNNNGIGIDGKPFDDGKKKSKEKKAPVQQEKPVSSTCLFSGVERGSFSQFIICLTTQHACSLVLLE